MPAETAQAERYVPRAAPAGVGEETAHRVGHGKAGFLPAGRFLGARCQRPLCWRYRGLGGGSAAAEIRANAIVVKNTIATIRLAQKDRAGIALHTLCSAPSAIIISHDTATHIMAGIPTIMKRMKIFPLIC